MKKWKLDWIVKDDVVIKELDESERRLGKLILILMLVMLFLPVSVFLLFEISLTIMIGSVLVFGVGFMIFVIVKERYLKHKRRKRIVEIIGRDYP